VIAPGRDYVVELPWIPPDPVAAGNTHFCLLARIETLPTTPFGMTFPEGIGIWQNVHDNNNIVWKNVTVVDNGAGGGVLIVRNTLNRAEQLTLRFAVPKAELSNPFLRHGDIVVDLGAALMEKWLQGGHPAVGFRAVANTTQIQITDPTNAVLSGLLFGAREEQSIAVRMQLHSGDTSPTGTIFNWDVIQLAPLTPNAEPSVLGGERYSFIVPAPQGRLIIILNHNGRVTLTWPGENWTLEESTDLEMWAPVAGNPTSPYMTPAASVMRFYRLRHP
jgi:hypothetical protein